MPSIEHSIVSYPQRGKWGQAGWNGNTSGYLIRDLIDTYNPRTVLDPMEGSGTTRDVCAEMDIPYVGLDFKTGDDILSLHTQSRLLRENREGFDMIFLHPPYWGMVKYSNNPADLSNGPYSLYLSRMHQILRFLAKCLSPDGFIALLLADFRTGGKTYFLTDDTTSLGVISECGLVKEARIIKIQHMTTSSGIVEHPGGFKFVHEYVTILRKRGAFAESPK